MKEPKKYLLNNCDPEGISDALVAVQRSFGLENAAGIFRDVETFGDICDAVVAAVATMTATAATTGTTGVARRADCTVQQAFYKLRAAIVTVTGAGVVTGDGVVIAPSTRLDALFPRWKRRRQVRELQSALGVELNLLATKPWVGWALLGGFGVSFLAMFINWRYGVAGMAACTVVNWAARRLANELTCETVGEVARLFAREHYRRARRDPTTVNPDEIVPVIKEIFRSRLLLEPEVLTPDARWN